MRCTLFLVFFLPVFALAEGVHSVSALHAVAATLGVIGGDPSSNPEVVPVGPCSGTWVSNNTLITAGHCTSEKGVTLYTETPKTVVQDGKKVEQRIITKIDLNCKRHPKYKPFEPSQVVKELEHKVKGAFQVWKSIKKKPGPEEDAFRMALAACELKGSEKPDHTAFLESAKYDIAVCTLPKPMEGVKSACVVKERQGFPANKNFIYSGFGTHAVDENGIAQHHSFFSQFQGRAKLEVGVAEEQGLLRGRWKKGSKDHAAAGKGDSGGGYRRAGIGYRKVS